MIPLYDELGGAEAISVALDHFYPKVLNAPLLAPYFKDVDMAVLKRKAESFLAMALGGAQAYDGVGLRAVHQRPRLQGMGDAEFDRFMMHFGATLQELGVSEDRIARVAAIAGAARDDVLGR